MANEKNRPNATSGELQTAIGAYEKLKKSIDSGASSIERIDVMWRMVRAIFYVVEIEQEAQAQLRWIVKGEEMAEQIISDAPKRVEGYYYAAVLKGRRAQVSSIGLGAIKLAEMVLEYGKMAAQIDESFEHGGPLRLLAMLYAKAPPWPTSIGDMDLALETAAHAIEVADYPMNHLIMAEVFIEDGELEQARQELAMVLSAPKVGDWAGEGEKWRPYAMKLLAEIKKE